jgi:tRNA(Arg) A34 adenosine deaminase TadA
MCLSAIYWARLDKIYYANGREDAAAIKFDDAKIYREVSVPIDQREIPLEQICREEALEVFKSWQEKEDKIRY